MCAIPRNLAPAVLLLAWFSGQAGTGFMIAHVARDHAVTESTGNHGALHHHARDHHSEADGESHDTDHGSDHTHEIVPATAVSPARVACASIDVPPCLAAIGHGGFDLPVPGAARHVAVPEPRAEPPGTRRHSILLI